MHFIDRKDFKDAPLTKLKTFDDKHKEKWKIYNAARFNKTKPLPTKPSSSWTSNEIRVPLAKLFLKNCGYCGIYTDIGSDAEVDHFHPTSKDLNADYIFNWNNYIWSCHSCNNKKKDNYPFLNPCSSNDMKFIYFHADDGKYLYFKKYSDKIAKKYNLTNENSNINDKNRPRKRKLIYNRTQEYFENIIEYNKLYKELSINKYNKKLKEEKEKIIEFINSGDSLYLIKHLMKEFKKEHTDFPYSFEELLNESGYL